MSAACVLLWPMRSMSFAEVRARVGGKLIAGAPQVVKVNASQADSGERGHPGATAEVAGRQRRALGTGEDESRGLVERGEVLAELRRDEVRERDDPPTGLRLGRPERVTAAALIDDLAGYPHGAGVEVDVWRAERGEF